MRPSNLRYLIAAALVTVGASLLLLRAGFTVAGGRPAAPAPGYDWPAYGGGLANGFANSALSGIAAADVSHLRAAWVAQADGEVSGNPIAVGESVFFGTWAGSVYAVSRQTGQTIWSTSLVQGRGQAAQAAAAVDGSPLYDGGRLFVATAGGQLVALDPKRGTVAWRSESLFGAAPDALRTGAKAYAGVIYVTIGGQGDARAEWGGVAALDEQTGRILWVRNLASPSGGGAAVFGAPAISPEAGLVFVGTGNPTVDEADSGGDQGEDALTDSLIALDMNTGAVVWAHQTHPHDQTDADFIASPNLIQLPSGQLLVGDGEKDGVYYALDAHTGKEVWHADLGLEGQEVLIVSTAAVSGGRIFVGTMDVPSGGQWPGNYQPPAGGRLAALDSATGRILWIRDLSSAMPGAPVAVQGAVLAMTAVGQLYALNAATGHTIWEAPAGGQLWNAEAGLTAAGRQLLAPLAQPGGVAAFRVP